MRSQMLQPASGQIGWAEEMLKKDFRSGEGRRPMKSRLTNQFLLDWVAVCYVAGDARTGGALHSGLPP